MMFARTFPMTHPRKGEPTYFVEKIWTALYLNGIHLDPLNFPDVPFDARIYNQSEPKGHTIRAGNRWKVGDYFTPRIWSGRPYNSKTIQFAPPIKVEKLWKIEMLRYGQILINDRLWEQLTPLAQNDGLTGDDFNNWFPPGKLFAGQIICWNKNIEY